MKHIYKKARLVVLSEWKTFVVSMAAILIYAVGVVGFTIPYQFADQGVMGIAVLLNYALGVNPAVSLLVMNAALLAWGARSLSKRFVIWTVINAFVLSAVMDALASVQFPVVGDVLLVAIIGAAIKGFGVGLLYREGVTAGGLDVAITVFRRRYGMEVGKLSLYFNAVILAVSYKIIGLEKVMYGALACYVCGMMMNAVLASFDKRRLIFIIATHTDAVVEFINKNLGRGCTLLSSEGGYKRHDGFTIMCLLLPRQVAELKRFLARNYPGSFMAVTDADEVVGKGFKSWRGV